MHPAGEIAGGAIVGDHIAGVAVAAHRVEEPAVEIAIAVAGRVAINGAIRERDDGLEVQGDAHLGAGGGGANGLHTQTVGEEGVMGGGEGRGHLPSAGSMLAGLVAEHTHAPRLIDGDPVADAIAEGRGDDPGILGEGIGRRARWPAPGLLQCHGQIPVVEGGIGGNAARQEGVHQAAVEIEAGLIDRAAPMGENARPGDAEAIGLQTERAHQGHVLLVAVVMVAGDVAGMPVARRARRVTEAVPDTGAAPVFVHGALDLVGRRGGAPDKAVWKAYCGHSQ